MLSETEYGNASIDTANYALMKMYLLEPIKDFSVQNDLAVGELNLNGDIDTLDFAVLKNYLIFLKILYTNHAAVHLSFGISAV